MNSVDITVEAYDDLHRKLTYRFRNMAAAKAYARSLSKKYDVVNVVSADRFGPTDCVAFLKLTR